MNLPKTPVQIRRQFENVLLESRAGSIVSERDPLFCRMKISLVEANHKPSCHRNGPLINYCGTDYRSVMIVLAVHLWPKKKEAVLVALLLIMSCLWSEAFVHLPPGYQL